MFKKIILIISFVTVFFYQAPLITPKVFAASDSGLVAAFKNLWEGIIGLFPRIDTAKLDSSKSSSISSQNSKKDFTDFTKNDKDWSHRTLSQSIRNKNIGVWFNEVINKPGFFSGKKAYSDEVVSPAQSGCPEIKITDIIYYYATKTDQKILYDRSSSEPIDYPSTIGQYASSLGPNSCYENAYKGIQAIPQGTFESEGDAALSSTQLNGQVHYTLPQNLQTNFVPDNSNAESTKETVEDTEDNLKRSRSIYMPQSVKDQVDCRDSLDDETKNFNLYKMFQKTITPQQWLSNTTSDDPTDSTEDFGTGKSPGNCASGSGLSQYGAEGMAEKNFSYMEILTAYYGIGNSGFAIGSVNSSEDKITVKLTIDSDSCDALVNEDSTRFQFGSEYEEKRTLILTVEDYLLGLSEIGLNWRMETHAALSVAARSFAYARSQNLTVPITNTSAAQNFRCGRLLSNLHEDNTQKRGVRVTTGSVITLNGSVFEAHYLRCFGGTTATYPFFNGTKYENSVGVFDKETEGTCDKYVLPPKISGVAAATSALFIYPNSSVHQARIAEDYDLAETSDSQYLQTYSGNCKLDTRISFGLNLMISAAKDAIPNLNIKFISCYRSTAEQQEKWEAALKKYNGDEALAAKYTARPGTSAHQTGRAIDFGDPSALDESSALYKWLVKNASKYGFYPYDAEAWHWEYNP